MPFLPTHCGFATIQIRVRLIMEKDVLKNPLTNRNAASAQLLYGQVTVTLLMGCAGFSHFGVSLGLSTFDFSVGFRHFGVSLVFSTFDFSFPST